MEHRDAVALIADAVGSARGGTWADLGAGEGTFTRALADPLGPDGRIYAMDSDTRAVTALRTLAREVQTSVIPIRGDFTSEAALASIDGPLDGILLANALHYVAEPGAALARMVGLLRNNGRVVLVEYDRRRGNRWVPYPIAVEDLPRLARAAGVTDFTVTASRPSAYQGIMYVAFAVKSGPAVSA